MLAHPHVSLSTYITRRCHNAFLQKLIQSRPQSEVMEAQAKAWMVNPPRVGNSVDKSYLEDTMRRIIINSTKRQSLPSMPKKITPDPVHYFVGLLTKKNTIQDHGETTIRIDCTSSTGILAKMTNAVPVTNISSLEPPYPMLTMWMMRMAPWPGVFPIDAYFASSGIFSNAVHEKLCR